MADKLGITEDIFVEVSEFRGTPRVDIRKWFDNKGEMSRGKNGLNVDAETWDDIVARWEDIKQYVEAELKRYKK